MDAFDTEARKRLAVTGRKALQAALIAFWELGRRQGTKAEQANRFGDSVLLADVVCERAVLHSYAGMGEPFLFVTEEHGVGVSMPNQMRLDDPHLVMFDVEATVAFFEGGVLPEGSPDPAFLVVCDGIDGTSRLKRRSPFFGTMAAAFEWPGSGISDDGFGPRYRECVFAGVVEHARLDPEGGFESADRPSPGTSAGNGPIAAGEGMPRRAEPVEAFERSPDCGKDDDEAASLRSHRRPKSGLWAYGDPTGLQPRITWASTVETDAFEAGCHVQAFRAKPVKVTRRECGFSWTPISGPRRAFVGSKTDLPSMAGRESGWLRTDVDLGIDCVSGIDGLPVATTFERILRHRYFPTTDLGSAAAQVAMIVNRDLDVACLATRKGNLELATMWLLLWMADGRLVNVSGGHDIGDKRFLCWGQDECVPLLAGSRNTAEAFARSFCPDGSRVLASEA